jgi:hypothetical protein
MEYGIWNMEYGIWNMEYGIWNMERIVFYIGNIYVLNIISK